MATENERVHLTLFVPGQPLDLEAWQTALEATGLGAALSFEVGVEWVKNPKDGSFGQALSFGTASAQEQQSIDAAPGALVLSLPCDLHRERSGIASLARALEIGRASCRESVGMRGGARRLERKRQ